MCHTSASSARTDRATVHSATAGATTTIPHCHIGHRCQRTQKHSRRKAHLDGEVAVVVGLEVALFDRVRHIARRGHCPVHVVAADVVLALHLPRGLVLVRVINVKLI